MTALPMHALPLLLLCVDSLSSTSLGDPRLNGLWSVLGYKQKPENGSLWFWIMEEESLRTLSFRRKASVLAGDVSHLKEPRRKAAEGSEGLFMPLDVDEELSIRPKQELGHLQLPLWFWIMKGKSLWRLLNHSEAEKKRRARINAHLDTLRSLVPGTSKVFAAFVPESKGKSLDELFGEAEPENGSTAESRQAVPV
ncbi:hypothetical protein DKX38_029680 [Salix brachista]|uniref:BHLH domain-containing protein n=1 Tax=Salix brachista TaxID=2182728 RepID=A0A5N5J1E5_9ROSI|nr:hypothetical protein DKX38_029680 [Salix brachista]